MHQQKIIRCEMEGRIKFEDFGVNKIETKKKKKRFLQIVIYLHRLKENLFI